jgi:hypothetical protein
LAVLRMTLETIAQMSHDPTVMLSLAGSVTA